MENNNIAAVAVPPAKKKGMHYVAVCHVGRVHMEYGNIWLGDGLGGTDKTLADTIGEQLAQLGTDELDGLARLTLTIDPLDDTGTVVEVV